MIPHPPKLRGREWGISSCIKTAEARREGSVAVLFQSCEFALPTMFTLKIIFVWIFLTTLFWLHIKRQRDPEEWLRKIDRTFRGPRSLETFPPSQTTPSPVDSAERGKRDAKERIRWEEEFESKRQAKVGRSKRRLLIDIFTCIRSVFKFAGLTC